MIKIDNNYAGILTSDFLEGILFRLEDFTGRSGYVHYYLTMSQLNKDFEDTEPSIRLVLPVNASIEEGVSDVTGLYTATSFDCYLVVRSMDTSALSLRATCDILTNYRLNYINNKYLQELVTTGDYRKGKITSVTVKVIHDARVLSMNRDNTVDIGCKLRFTIERKKK